MKNRGLRIVKNEATSSAKIYLYGVIGDYWSDSLTSKAFIRQLTTFEAQGIKRVDVHLNGPGGDVLEGLGILNAIRSSKMEIHTYNDGVCASMHAAILASAKTGNRHGAKASLVMIHNASTIVWGTASELRDAANFLDTHDVVLAGIFADATGEKLAEIQAKYFDHKDHWLSAQESADMNLVVLEDYQATDMPDNASNMNLQQVAAYYNPNVTLKVENREIMKLEIKNLVALATAQGEAVATILEEANGDLKTAGINGVILVEESFLDESAKVTDELKAVKASLATATAEQKKVTDELENANTRIATAKTDLQKAQDELKAANEKALKAEAKVTELENKTPGAPGKKPVNNGIEGSTGKKFEDMNSLEQKAFRMQQMEAKKQSMHFSLED